MKRHSALDLAPRTASLRLLALCAAATAPCACLPEDTRATPGSVVVTASADSASGPDGFLTSDGWHVVYERLLVVVGEVELEGDDCDQYSENEYSRVLDMTHGEPQRVSLLHGLGVCDFTFRVSAPRWNTTPG